MAFDFSAIEPIDFAFSTAIQSIASNPFDLAFNLLTQLGNPAFWIIVAAIIYWQGKERDSFFLVNLVVFSAAIVAFAKTFFDRPRPSEEKFRVAKDLFPKLEASEINSSFPSGHSAMVSSAFFYFKKVSGSIKTVLLAAVLIVCFSRIYLGKHYLSDVIAGLLAGFIIGNANNFLKKTVEKKELKITKLEYELGFILALIAALTAVIFLNTPNLALTVLGYYAGFFLFKELSQDQKPVNGKKAIAKIAIGLGGLGAIALTLQFLQLNKTIESGGYFLLGFWISLIWPVLWQKASK